MKIAFIVPGFSASEDDWCIPAHTDIVCALARSHNVHVFAMRYPHRVDTYKIGAATVHSFNGVGRRGASSAHLWQNVWQAIVREHQCARFDVIHAIFGSEAGCVAVLAGKFLRVPSVVWMVNGELVGLREIGYGANLIARQRWMNNLILRLADRVLFGSAQAMEFARRRNSRARLEFLPLGVNTERFHPIKPVVSRDPLAVSGSARDRRDGDALRLMNVGSLSPVKDQMMLLRAFEIVARKLSNARLTIAGSGVLENDLRALARELNLETRVNFVGNIAHDQLPNLYQGTDVFVQSSRHEGQGMALLEAAACGCAVCGTNVGALADLARADAGVAAAVGDANALARAIELAYAKRPELSARASQKVEREYNLPHVAARLENLYARLTRGEHIVVEHNVIRT